MSSPHVYSAQVVDQKGESLVLQTPNGVALEWPLRLLSGNPPKKGDTIYLSATSKSKDGNLPRKLALHVLNEMLEGI